MSDMQPIPQAADRRKVSISASDLVEVVAGQLSVLHGLTVGLEDALSQALCACNPLSNDTIQTLQRVDFLRQSLKDIENILLTSGSHIEWHVDGAVPHDTLLRSVSMTSSLIDILEHPEKVQARPVVGPDQDDDPVHWF